MLRALLTPSRLGVHLLALVAVVAAVGLGVWQYGAWSQHRAEEAEHLAEAPVRPLADVLGPDAAFPGDAVAQPVRFEGSWLPASTFFVSGREHDQRTGYWVVTPVAVTTPDPSAGTTPARASGAPAMLVVRGWTRDPDDVPDAPHGPVRVTGWLQPGEGAGLEDPDPGDDVLPELRIASAIQRVDQDLYGGYVIARDPAAPRPLAAVTPASLPDPSTFTAVRNLLYALEWWVFGGFAAVVWWRWCRDVISSRVGSTV